MTTPLRCAVDASVGIKQFIPNPLSPKIIYCLLTLRIHKLKSLYLTCFKLSALTTLWKYARAQLYVVTDIPADLDTRKAFPLCVVSIADLMADGVTIGLTYGISAYDACYVALSQQVSATLLTLDQRKREELSRYILCLLVQ